MSLALPEDAATTLIGLLGRYNDGKIPRNPTDTYVKLQLKGWPAAMDVIELLTAMSDADPNPDDDPDFWAQLDPVAIANRLIAGCAEFKHLQADDERDDVTVYGERIRWVWKLNTAVKNDRAVLGTTSVVSQADRDLWPVGAGRPPMWKITLSLQAWIALSEMDRIRLVHHELAHVGLTADADGAPKACINAHDIEENLSTLARFGLADKSQAKVVAAAMAHPATEERMRAWFIDPATGQGALWPPPISQTEIAGVNARALLPRGVDKVTISGAGRSVTLTRRSL